MSVRLNFLFVFIIVSVILNAQTTIKGTVCDSVTNDTLPYATIRIFNANNDSLIYSTISDLDGHFQIKNIPYGKYLFQCSYIGFEKWIKIIWLNKKELILKIRMKPEVNIIETVVVKGEKKYSEQFNKTIFRPDSAIIKNSSNALDVLKNINLIEVDQLSGTITLLGESNTLVLIDNIPISRQKPLSSINPGEIERVEIINNPSSKYDAEYSGVINIILKKEKNKGISISTSTGALYNFGLFDFNIEYSGLKSRFFVSSYNKYRKIKYDMHNNWKYENDTNLYIMIQKNK
jgi:hypothetical protein